MYQIRKCKQYTAYLAATPASLDPDKFRNLSVPYEGSSEQEFFDYLTNNSYELEEIYEELDEETKTEMEKIWYPEYEEYSNSEYKFEDSWYESGKENEEWRKTGNFEIFYSTAQ